MRDLIRNILREELMLEMPKKSNTEDFIRKAKEIHGDKYDYTPTNYINATTKVEINCPKHGVFLVSPNSHLSKKSGCKLCYYEKAKENQIMKPDEFIRRANLVHGGKYDYSNLNYKGSGENINFICPIHGLQTNNAYSHLQGSGCKECHYDKLRQIKPKTPELVLKQFEETHGDFYDYSQIDYKGAHTKVKIICPIHGEFYQTPNSHRIGNGCPDCGHEKMKVSAKSKSNDFIKDFVIRAEQVHGKFYDYSESNIKNSTDKIKIICPNHGEFYQSPDGHLQGGGCTQCGYEKSSEQRRLTIDDFIKRAKSIHGDKYDYSQVQFTGQNDYVNILCPKHGIFSQTVGSHLHGKSGCPICKESRGVKFVTSILRKYNVEYVREKKFKDCVNVSGGGKYCRQLPFDIFIPSQNTIIEYDGKQHFEPVSIFGGEEQFQKQQKLDKIKNDYCRDNGIKLIRIPYTTKDKDIETLLRDESVI